MTTPILRVTPEALRTAAQRCEALAANVASVLPPVTASAWQGTGAVTSAVNAGMSTVGIACKSRMTANAGKLTRAAGDYENQEGHATSSFNAVASHVPAGLGGDGGSAGGLPRMTPLVPRRVGGDGGAGGFGVGR